MELYERHAISADFPQLEGDRFDLLVESMRRRGFDPLEPITLFEGRILDGWNRQRAALVAAVEPIYQPFEGSVEAAVNYSLDKNTARRQLTKSAEVYALLTVNAQLPEDRRLSDAAIMRRTGASATAISNAHYLRKINPTRAEAIGRGKDKVETAEREEGVNDTYKRKVPSGEKAFALRTRLAQRFDKARDKHPKRLPPQSALNQAVELWSKVCEEDAPVVVSINHDGKLNISKHSEAAT